MLPSEGPFTPLLPRPLTTTKGLHRSKKGTLLCMMTVMVLESQAQGELWPEREYATLGAWM